MSETGGTSSGDAVETTIVQTWKDVLLLDSIDRDLHFIEQGGDSLSATLIAIDLGTKFSVEITSGDIYANPTVAELSVFVRDHSPAG